LPRRPRSSSNCSACCRRRSTTPALGRLAQLFHHRQGGAHEQFLPARQQFVGQRPFQRRQPAGLEACLVGDQPRRQRFARRQREHALRWHTQRGRGAQALLFDLGLDFCHRAQRVEQGIDLVEHHEAFQAGLAQVVAPDGQVGTRDAGVGGQHEDHRVRSGQQAQRQFGFGADGVQAWRVDHHQTRFQQWVRVVDHRVAPGRHLDLPSTPTGGLSSGWDSSQKPSAAACCTLDALGARDGGQGLHQRRRVAWLQGHHLPQFVARTQLGQRQAAQPRFDGQQGQAGWHVGS
jgi:hypothetical protein